MSALSLWGGWSQCIWAERRLLADSGIFSPTLAPTPSSKTSDFFILFCVPLPWARTPGQLSLSALQGWSFDGDCIRKVRQPNQDYGFFWEKIPPQPPWWVGGACLLGNVSSLLREDQQTRSSPGFSQPKSIRKPCLRGLLSGTLWTGVIEDRVQKGIRIVF